MSARHDIHAHMIQAATADCSGVEVYHGPEYLSDEQAEELRVMVRDTYRVGDPIRSDWHPVMRAEAARMNAERFILFTVE